MGITIKDIEYLETLAKLSFKPEERENLLEKLNTVIGYGKKLEEVPMGDLEKGCNSLPMSILRDDKVQESMELEKVLMNAPEKQESYFKVPGMMK